MPARPRRIDEVSAGAVVVRRVGGSWEVCLVRVGQAWSLPKGNLEAGETPVDAAVREVAEETGLRAESLRVVAALPAAEYAYRRRDGRLVFKRVEHFLVEATGETEVRPQPEEIDEVAWVPLDEAHRRVAYRDLQPVLAEARRLLAAAGG
jgi:8-oxo-dGTP diphosphatase